MQTRTLNIRQALLLALAAASCDFIGLTGCPTPIPEADWSVLQSCTLSGPAFVIDARNVDIAGTLSAPNTDVTVRCTGNATITGQVTAKSFVLLCQGAISIGNPSGPADTVLVQSSNALNISNLPEGTARLRPADVRGNHSFLIFQSMRVQNPGQPLRLAAQGQLSIASNVLIKAGDGTTLPDTTIIGTDGSAGGPGQDVMSNHQGGNGGTATVIARGGLSLGDSATVRAGNGGGGGNLALTGGRGGDGTTGGQGGDAVGESRGGEGGGLTLEVIGSIALGNGATVRAGNGGSGGAATATGGGGGDGTSTGGAGGAAAARSIGGDGGDVTISLDGNIIKGSGAAVVRGNGGAGGEVAATGGAGGAGSTPGSSGSAETTCTNGSGGQLIGSPPPGLVTGGSVGQGCTPPRL